MNKYLVLVTEVAYYEIRVAANDAMEAKNKALMFFYERPKTPKDYGTPKVVDVAPY